MEDPLARAEALVARYPKNELARFSLGKAYFDRGEFEIAKSHLEQALAVKPDWMVVQILIGKCDLALGRNGEAKKAFARARQLAIDQHHEGPLAEMDAALAELR
jgi:tetratricopeptide (TPR) repeat protein